MKELYIAPEAEIIRFVAEEELAAGVGFGEIASNVGFEVENQADGNWANWDKWFQD